MIDPLPALPILAGTAVSAPQLPPVAFEADLSAVTYPAMLYLVSREARRYLEQRERYR